MPSFNEIRVRLGDACRAYQPGLNVDDFVPAGIRPPMAVIQPAAPTIAYTETFYDPDPDAEPAPAEWHFWVRLIAGQVAEEAAQILVGELITPGSQLINALNAVEIENGYVEVLTGTVDQTPIGGVLYAEARLAVHVRTG